MRRYFNTEGLCKPNEHYMVRIDDRLERIKRLFVDQGKYFTINRGRQYGKTTTLRALAEYLRGDYLVVSMDFQMMSTASFENEKKFVNAFVRYFVKSVKEKEDTSVLKELTVLETGGPVDMDEMFVQLGKICEVSTKPVVMMIDEVDSASNNQVFLDFLALLRGYYLERENKSTFQSVILAGVYDIKNLKLKIRPEGEHKYNSPWNIAARFNLDMSFSTDQIACMLREYEEDNKTGMDIHTIAKCIYEYTSGYPYLVSAICKLLDEEIPESNDFEDMASVWTEEGIAEAVKIILKENTPLFDSMVKQLNIYKGLRNMIEEILYQGKEVFYSPDVESINMGMMFGLLKEKNNHVVISNRIFEMRLLNMFIAEEAVKSEAYRYGQRDKNQFIRDSRLNMDLVLEKFVEYFTELYGENDERFVEAYGRKFFLLYLKPIINGVGNYYMEAQTRDAKRTDVIVDYLGEQFVVELKIWRGNEYNERGEDQLIGYLDYFHQKKGYMLSFNFNKRKEVGVKVIEVGDKVIVEAVV
ncbi:MAG: 9-O-acetyl-N-acetylneuraminate esterase [Hungatella sp.]|nr:9-O-acetyl-N-acetylneuraminate esterase [Hungatella sp.]